MGIKDDQMEAFVIALERQSALYGFDGTLFGNEAGITEAAWKSIAAELNTKRIYAKVLNGTIVKGKWSDMKYRLKKKVKALNNGEEVLVSSIDKRVLKLLGGHLGPGGDTASVPKREQKPPPPIKCGKKLHAPIRCVKRKLCFRPDDTNDPAENPDTEGVDDSEVIVGSEVTLPQIFASQESDANASDAQESHFMDHDSNVSYQDDQNSSASINHEVFNDFHVETTSSDNEALDIIESLGVMPSTRLFRGNKSIKKTNIERLLEIEETKLKLKAEKIRQTKRIADSLAILVDLKKKQLKLSSKES